LCLDGQHFIDVIRLRRSLMNRGCLESSFGPDRLATQEEVRCAISSSSTDAPESAGSGDDLSEVLSDVSARAPDLREEIEWLTVAREKGDCVGN
jgi:hypothetical protein